MKSASVANLDIVIFAILKLELERQLLPNLTKFHLVCRKYRLFVHFFVNSKNVLGLDQLLRERGRLQLNPILGLDAPRIT